jgi:membrane-bound metal-dependent hydrolase YbcI (DUF457 family)
MMGHTHMVFGFLVGLVMLPVFSPASPILFVTLTTIAALFPDVDHEGSKINKYIPVTRWASRFFKHRGFFHSVWPAIIIYALFFLAGWREIGLAITVGYMSHLVSDSITKMGINFLHPFSTLRVQGFLTTGGVWELAFLGGFIVLSALKLWQTFF